METKKGGSEKRDHFYSTYSVFYGAADEEFRCSMAGVIG